MSWDEQIERIISKIEQASLKDGGREVFGAKSHQYTRKPVLSMQEIEAFEREHGIQLPLPYRLFLARVGNGGAGPYYGIYPLDKNNSGDRLSEPFQLKPDLSDEEWKALTDFEDEAGGDEYDEAFDRLFQGMLALGTQGCTYEMGLVLNGEYNGRIVYYDGDLQKPFFTYEANFLDWYERWLDEIIHGYTTSWFGMTRGGDDTQLTTLYREASDPKVQLSALKGMYKLQTVHPGTLLLLKEIMRAADSAFAQRSTALELLAKFGEEEAGPWIRSLLASRHKEAQSAALQTIRYYISDQTPYTGLILECLPTISEPKAFALAAYILEQNGQADSGPFVAFFRHENEKLRREAVYTVGKMPDKSNYVQNFIECLQADKPSIVLTAVQSLRGVTDPRLLPCYGKLLEQHEHNEDYILSNVLARLEEFGRQAQPVLQSAAVHPHKETREKAISLLGQPMITSGIKRLFFRR
ncbi:SMI1/KNR4 family protein [Paenibacillus albidus]|uniref:SMI1/KNR4 family protein n=1 Tax=Paenibacillus albidus TaxID=2041023 RepID=UPI001BECD1EB|nr:SMI1/KNR4 family protein [Paenibacillus albidus]MBT2293571.1 SMI1/KNR4 family protein [Paenibacillus albidus]